jgi:hypothetical protein
MKERPIIFSAPMVRAILAGAKTQTRRVVKLPADAHSVRYWAPPLGRSQPGYADPGINYWTADKSAEGQRDGTLSNHLDRCPHGQRGDRLWVREAWSRDEEDGALFYRADVGTGNEADDWQRNIDDGASGYRWKPSIFMPRCASRITLEVTAVRVERLQDISEADALAEGVSPKWEPGCSGRLMEAFGGFSFRPAASAYAELWEQINGSGSWDFNPWVWAIEFKRVTP